MESGIIIVLLILSVTVIMLILDFVRTDIVAIGCMLALGWTGILNPQEMFSGFSSNAVVAMAGVMILGRGIARTGIMDEFSKFIISKAGTRKRNLEAGLWKTYHVNLLGIGIGDDVVYAPGRESKFVDGQTIAVLGSNANIKQFSKDFQLEELSASRHFSDDFNANISGFAEVIIPPASELVGKTLSPFFILLMVGVLSTVFSLFMSNVGAIVVLAPLLTGMAGIAEIDPRPLVLMAAVCVANSFILPTHQVNAFLMSSGGYRNADYIKAGNGMTILFLTITVFMFYFFMI